MAKVVPGGGAQLTRTVATANSLTPSRVQASPFLDAQAAARAIVDAILPGSGPILLCVPGTGGGAFETSMLSLAQAFERRTGGAVSIASIPYANGVSDILPRLLHRSGPASTNVLALVVRELRRRVPQRPIYVAGESQGAWMISDLLGANADIARAITRVALFGVPGFVRTPIGVGDARNNANVMSINHTDDIVPNLIAGIGWHVLRGYVAWLSLMLHGQPFNYAPHHYEAHGEDGARWLLDGIRPAFAAMHESSDDAVRSAQR